VRTRPREPPLKATEQPIDTSTAAGKAFLDMLGVEFETNLRRERQLVGIAKAKAAGVYKGRKPSIAEKLSRLSRLRAWAPPHRRNPTDLSRICSASQAGPTPGVTFA